MNVCASSKQSFYGGYPLNELIPTNYSQLLLNIFSQNTVSVLDSARLYSISTFIFNSSQCYRQKWKSLKSSTYSNNISMGNINSLRIKHKNADSSIDWICFFLSLKIDTWHLEVNRQSEYSTLVMSVNRFTPVVCHQIVCCLLF